MRVLLPLPSLTKTELQISYNDRYSQHPATWSSSCSVTIILNKQANIQASQYVAEGLGQGSRHIYIWETWWRLRTQKVKDVRTQDTASQDAAGLRMPAAYIPPAAGKLLKRRETTVHILLTYWSRFPAYSAFSARRFVCWDSTWWNPWGLWSTLN